MNHRIAACFIVISSITGLAACQSMPRAFREELSEGMTTQEVWKKWGSPDKVEQTSAGSTSEETWKWSGSTWSLAVFKDGRLVRWRK